MASLVKSIKYLKNNYQSFSNSSKKYKKKGILPNTFFESSITMIPKPNKKRKLQANIPNEHVCKNPHENTRKLNSIVH